MIKVSNFVVTLQTIVMDVDIVDTRYLRIRFFDEIFLVNY